MNKKIILGLVGPIASGKGTVAKYLQEKQGANVYKFSTVLRDVLQRLHLDVSRKNLQDISTILRKSFGEDILAKTIAEDTEKDQGSLVVVDGIRRWADITYLNKKDNFILVGVDADPKIRYQRLIKRKENEGDSSKTYEEFLKDQDQEADAEIPEIINSASELIYNDHELEVLYNNIDSLLNKYNYGK